MALCLFVIYKGECMGRNNKAYYKDLHQQAYDKFKSMQAFGESKKEAIKDGSDINKIFSYNTYHTYWKHTKYFLSYIKEKHPEVTTLKAAKKYVKEWLEYRVNSVNAKGEPLSAWTIQTEAKALGKLFGIRPGDKEYFEAPKRERKEIKRSRGDAERDKHFSVTNNDELIKFCKGTGLRREGMAKVKGKDLMTKKQILVNIKKLETKENRSAREDKVLGILKDAARFTDKHEYFVYAKEKGGRERIAPIVGPNVEQIVERFKNTPKDKNVWEHIHSNADIHGYRGDYATTVYKEYARDIKDIPFDRVNKGTGRKFQGDVYACRKDEAGKKLDKAAMLMCTKALGHNRLEVVANNYIRGL